MLKESDFKSIEDKSRTQELFNGKIEAVCFQSAKELYQEQESLSYFSAKR